MVNGNLREFFGWRGDFSVSKLEFPVALIHRKWPLENQTVTWPMTSRDPKGQTRVLNTPTVSWQGISKSKWLITDERIKFVKTRKLLCQTGKSKFSAINVLVTVCLQKMTENGHGNETLASSAHALHTFVALYAVTSIFVLGYDQCRCYWARFLLKSD